MTHKAAHPLVGELIQESDKGTCNIEVDQSEEGTIISDYASGPEMSNAAQYLINECAERTGRGGTAKPLGRDPLLPIMTSDVDL